MLTFNKKLHVSYILEQKKKHWQMQTMYEDKTHGIWKFTSKSTDLRQAKFSCLTTANLFPIVCKVGSPYKIHRNSGLSVTPYLAEDTASLCAKAFWPTGRASTPLPPLAIYHFPPTLGSCAWDLLESGL